MSPYLVRLGTGPWHLAQPTGRGYSTACGRHLHGERIDAPPRWRVAHVWALGRACKRCEALSDRCRTDRELAQAAGWA